MNRKVILINKLKISTSNLYLTGFIERVMLDYFCIYPSMYLFLVGQYKTKETMKPQIIKINLSIRYHKIAY